MEARVVLTRVFPPSREEEGYALFSGYAIVPTEEGGSRTMSCGVMLKYRPLTEAAGGILMLDDKPYHKLVRHLSFVGTGFVLDDPGETKDEFIVKEITTPVRVCVPRKRFEVTIE